jgi:hypothetical protein
MAAITGSVLIVLQFPISPEIREVSALLLLSRDRVSMDGVWIGNSIYCTLTTRNYN